MIRQTKIFIFLIFSLFMFYMVEQNIMLHKQTHYYAVLNPLNDPVDPDNLITEDTEITAEDALNSTTPSLQQFSIAHKIVMAIKHRSLVTVISDHWEPPKKPDPTYPSHHGYQIKAIHFNVGATLVVALFSSI